MQHTNFFEHKKLEGAAGTTPRILLIDHSYHQTTGSSAFFHKILQQDANVSTYWDESWREGGIKLTAAELNRTTADAIVFFQQLPSRRELSRLRNRNITWVPMRDALTLPSRSLRKLSGAGIKVLNFSAEAHDEFTRLGFESLRVRYCIPPAAPSAPPSPTPSSPRIFFWMRREEIAWPTLRALLGTLRPSKIILRISPDPGHSPAEPSEQEQRDYNIIVIRGWLPPAQYLSLLNECQVFMAPRLLEGIGMATLEAMAAGLAVIAPNAATMNEYIRHGETGYLYSPSKPAPLDLGQYWKLGANARDDIRRGHQTWMADARKIVPFILKTPEVEPDTYWKLRKALKL